MTTRAPSRSLGLLLALMSLLATFAVAAPASAQDRVVTITAEGVIPRVLEVAAGDRVTFVNEDSTFGYRARATSDNWDLDSGAVGLLPGRSYTHPDPITEAGTYTYRVAEGEPYQGSVVLRGANSVQPGPGEPEPGPRESRPAAPPPPPPPPPPAPSPTGGAGTAQPPVAGGFGSLGGPPSPPAAGVGPPPAIALPGLPPSPLAPQPETAPEPEAARGPLAVPGRLGAPAGYRGYGLPAALAAVLAAGVASLLVRLLLAEPAARRRARGAMAGRAPLATVD